MLILSDGSTARRCVSQNRRYPWTGAQMQTQQSLKLEINGARELFSAPTEDRRAFAKEDAPTALFRHRDCNHDMQPVLACSACGDEFHARSVELNLVTETRDGAAVRGARLSPALSFIGR